jgi:hypothetical protein
MTAAHSDEDGYHYQPVKSEETGGKVRMRSQENRDIKVVKVDTPRVGTDGLREALKAKYGVKKR